jgi:hypothetical protein
MGKNRMLRLRADFEDSPIMIKKQLCKEKDIDDMVSELKHKLFGK